LTAVLSELNIRKTEMMRNHETFFGWLVIAKNYYFNITKHFYLVISVSARDLHQKKLVQF